MSKRGKDKYVTTKLSDNIQMVSLAVNSQPVMRLDNNKGIVKFGAKNDWPDYLISLFKNSVIHGAICNGKARYLSGINIKPKEANPAAEVWLKQIKAHELTKRLDVDEVISGMEYVLINPNIIGQPTSFTHLDFAKCRISSCYGYVLYNEDWSSTQTEIIKYPIWNEGIKTTAVQVYRRYTPTSKKIESVYATPEWSQATLDIDSDWEISSFSNSLIKNNFSVGKIVTIFSGKIPKDKQEELKAEMLGDGTGTQNGGRTVFSFANEGAKGAEIAEAGATDLDKQYQEIRKSGRENILTGHGVSGSLFKVKVGDTAWTRSDLVEAHELFINEYVKPKQERRLKWFTYMYKLRTGLVVEFEFEQIKTIGLDLPLENQAVVTALNAKDPNIITNYILEKYNIKVPEVIGANGLPVTATQTSVNDNLKGLSAAENADAIRIVRDFKKGRMPEAMALSRLMSYGLTEPEARKWLDMPEAQVQMAYQKNKKEEFLTLFQKYAHPINLEDEVLDVEYVDVNEVHLTVALQDIRNAVLNKVKEGVVDVEKLAGELGVTEDKIKSTMDWLTKKELITPELKPTQKALDLKPEFKTEIYTEYTYDLAKGVSYANNPNRISDKLLSTSHDFCKDMVRLTSKNALSYEDINAMSNDFGEDAWSFRGGYTMQKNGIVKPWCNHQWKAEVKLRKVKV